MTRLLFLTALSLVSAVPYGRSDSVVAELVERGHLPAGSALETIVDAELGRQVVLRVPTTDGLVLEEGSVEQIHRAFLAEIDGHVAVCIQAADSSCRPLPAFLPAIPPVPRKAWEPPATEPVDGPFDVPGHSAGFLAGRTVYVSQGHGWTWTVTEWWQRWATQRGNTWGVVEDFVNAEAINQYLLHYLRNAGATVYTVREADMQSQWVIVDDGDGLDYPSNGRYEEFGTFAASTSPGYANFQAPYPTDEPPMTNGATRYAYTTADNGTFARWTPNVPADGRYAVYVSYAASDNRNPQSRYLVNHAGGSTEYIVDQTRHGATWNLLGYHYFRSGTDADHGSVELFAQASQDVGDTVVSADAVRLGGGMGVISRGTGSGLVDSATSGRPRWEENARYAAQFNGAPETVYDYSTTDNNDDVGTRSRYAAWQHEAGERAVYVSWHTNAPNPGTGTSTYVYGPNEPNGDYIFTGTQGSDVLAELLHNEVVQDIRNGYDAGWTDRGIRSAWFGELNPSHNDEMPAALVEVAFHDTESDCLKLQDPKFRQLVARAFYQAIVRYFAWEDGVAPVFLPEAPTGVAIETTGPGTARLTWRSSPTDEWDLGGHAAAGYKVYSSFDGHAWDNGKEVGDVTEWNVLYIPVDQPMFYKITAINAGGESFASPVLAVRQDAWGQKGALVVGAFDRLDRHALLVEDLSPWDLGTVRRMRLDRMNRYDYVIEHARALDALGMPFDSAWHDAPLTLDGLLGYSLVDWWCGEESTTLDALSPAELELLQGVVQQGGRILVSGAEIGWDLVEKGSADEQAAFGQLFHAQYLGDDAESYSVVLPSGLSLGLDDGTQGTYDVDYPDLIGPTGEASAIGNYDGDPARPAGTVYSLQNGAGAVLLGFPLEAVQPEGARSELLEALLDQLGVAPPGPPSVVEPDPVVESEPDIIAVADLSRSDDLPVAPADVVPDSELPGVVRKARSSGCRSGPESPASLALILLLFLLYALARVASRNE